MRLLFPLIVLACLAGCKQTPAYNSAEAAEHHIGRYFGIGVYPATDLWAHLAAVNRPNNAAAATTADDSQVIVVVDSNTGEIRQCGNLSGHCVGMNPWAAALGQGQAAPVALDAHAADLAREAQQNEADGAANSMVPARRR